MIQPLSRLRSGVVVCFLCATASLLSAAQERVVINEIHYNPDVKTEPAEFVELYNAGTNAVNLAGWSFSDGLNYTFPATNISPGGYVVVAQNPAFLQTKFNAAGALGPFNSDRSAGLSKYGEKLTLRNAAGDLVDEVEYKPGFPWPTVGDPPGYSIELINPGLDNNLGGSWRASVATAGTAPSSQVLIPAQSRWSYLPGTNEASSPVTAWRFADFDDSLWPQGLAPIGYGESFITTPLAMQNNYLEVFFRKTFEVDDPTWITSLLLEGQFDDGAKIWINGVSVRDVNMPTGEVPATTTAILSVEAQNFIQYILDNPGAYLVPGTNIVAIQGANVSLGGSSDFVMDLRLTGRGGPSGNGPTPGRLNSVYAVNAPPQIRQVASSPEQPASGQPVHITAKVTDPDGVAAVTLEYQVVLPGQYIELTDPAYTNAVNWISLPMKDDGSGGDETAGDDVFTSEIPASVQAHRRLIRYRITVRDTRGSSVRVPYADDPQPNFAYFVYDGVPAWRGAVQPGATGSNGVTFTVRSNEMARLPVLQLLAKSNSVATATWFSRYGGDLYPWAGTLVYDGKVYDHIHYRARGGVWRYSMVKNMWKFDLNRGHDFEARDPWGRKFSVPWRKINLGAVIQQGDFWHRGEQGLFESVTARLMRLAGVESYRSAFLTLRVVDDVMETDPVTQYEGDFWGLYMLVEQEDGRLLEEHGLPDSNFYKMEGGTGTLNNLGPTGPADKSDLNYILNNSGSASEAWWRTNWNLAKFWSYQAIVQATHHYDISDGKNYFYYFDPRTRLWELMPWDFDLTWAHNMYRSDSGGCGVDAIMTGLLNPNKEGGSGPQAGTGVMRLSGQRPALEIEFRNRLREVRELLFNTNETFRLINEQAALLRGIGSTNPTILDADRAQWDYNPKMISSAYSESVGKAQQGYFYQFPQESGTNATLKGSFESALRVMRFYVNIRSAYLDSLAADAAIPARPIVSYTGPSNYPINRLTFRAPAYAGANPFSSLRWRVGEITDTNSPSYQPGDPWKYEIETLWDSGPITVFSADITLPAGVFREGSRYRVRLQFADTTGRQSQWSLPVEFTSGSPENMGDLLNFLRITEVMYHPPAGGYEFIELHNASSTATLDLAGVKFIQGVDFTFLPGTSLLPGAYLLLIGTANIPAFRVYYRLDESVPIVAAYTGALNNAGEQVTLRTSAGGTDIVSFLYKDGRGWPTAADGAGHSLVLQESAERAEGSGAGDFGGNWRASTYLRGSPGRADAPPPASPLLNEIAVHPSEGTAFDSGNWIELYNPTDNPILLGPGWYLSDDAVNLAKWMIPAATRVPARGWVSFDELTQFHNPANTGFGLNQDGGQVYLSFLAGTAEDRVVDAVTFKAQESGWSLGRSPDGAPFWDALAPRTREAANAAPPPRVVINEVLYHPPDIGGTNDNSLDEFIELFNPGPAPVELFNTHGAWRLDGGVSFTLPGANLLAAGGYLLLVNFDPATNAAQLAAFKSRYGLVSDSLPIFGPYGGKLDNSSDRVALERPQASADPLNPISWVMMDEVIYADQSPWPCGTDGTGNSLQRISAAQHGCDPANWIGEAPTPGGPRAYSGASLPTIVSQPQDRIAPTDGTASFSVAVCGLPPFTYQWQHNGLNLDGATNATLTLTRLQLAQSGSYAVVVSNPGGSVSSGSAQLIVQYAPVIVHPPISLTVTAYTTVSWSVEVSGTPPVFYQWRFNGGPLAGQTNATLVLTNVQKSQEGNYNVSVLNSAGTAVSSNASLTVLIPATITRQPTNTTVAGGSNVTFTVAAIGAGPLRYQWRFNGANLATGTNASLLLTNAQLSQMGAYDVIVTDDIQSVTSQAATLMVLVKPVFTVQPRSMTALEGGIAVFTVASTGTTPMSYRWRRAGVTFTNANGFVISSPTNSTLTLTNLKMSDGTYYSVVVTNPAGQATLSSNANLLVLADFDRDGMADAWERANGFSTNSAADALLDADGDGMSNRDEYLAGTDPRDASSFLKVEILGPGSLSTNQVRLTFQAVSNRSYAVWGNEAVSSAVWSKVTDLPAAPTNRTVEIMDLPPQGPARRFYRLVIP